MRLMRFAMVVLFATSLMSCGGSDSKPKADEQAPSIALNSPTAGEVSYSNDITVTATVSDNVDLQSVVFTLVKNPSSQSLTKGDDTFSYDSRQDDSFTKVGSDFKTGNFSVNHTIDLEDAAAQDYTFTIEATDASGNKETKEVSITVTRP